MIKAILDPRFQPMVKVVSDYKAAVAKAGGVPLVIAVERNKGYVSTYKLDVYKDGEGHDEESYGIVERIVKTLLWVYGGFKITVAGSSSVTPVMEKLKEAYCELNPEVTIEINQSDSTTGMSAAADGICDIGMASRDLKDSELEKGLTPTVIAMDGIAVIVSNDNPVNELSSEQVKNIYTGDVTSWESLISE